MANPLKGEVALSVGDRDFTLLFDINALGELEERLDMDSGQIVGRLAGRLRIKFLKALLWAALREHHSDLTDKDIGHLIQEVGVPVAEVAVINAIRASFPEATEDANASDDPQAAEGPGTGSTSSSSGANSD